MSRATYLAKDESNANRFQGSPKSMQFKGVYDYFILNKMLIIVRKRKRKHLTLKTDSQIFAHDLETKSRINIKIVLH